MNKLTQKWCVVALFEDANVGYEFSADNWPLHLTFIDVHDAPWKTDDKLLTDFKHLTSNQKPFTTKALEIGSLGPQENPTKVTFIDMNKQVIELHYKLVELLNSYDATFNNPEYNLEGFIAHSTLQKHAKIDVGSLVTVNNLALIDMFPHQDGTRRKITDIVKLHS